MKRALTRQEEVGPPPGLDELRESFDATVHGLRLIGEATGAGKDESDESEKSDKTDNDSKKAG